MLCMTVEKDVVIERFIVRRAFRVGRTTRSDVMMAFGISSASATRAMSNTAAVHSRLLTRERHALTPRPLAEPPSYANEADLLKELDAGRCDFSNLGLNSDELPIHYVQWTNSMPMKAGILSEVITAIRTETILEIVYLGLRKNEQPRRRQVLPLGLERMNDQWRVIAQDMDDADFPVKLFVLPRVLEAKCNQRRKPKGMVVSSTHDLPIDIAVRLNGSFTEVQKRVIAHELQVNNDMVRIPSRSLFEFLRRFTDQPPHPEIVWPPLIKR